MSRLTGLVLSGAVVAPFAVGLVVGQVAAQAQPAGDEVFRFTDSRIFESSGLVVDPVGFATTNDSGDTGQVFTVDPDTGDTVGVTAWSEDPQDVEALAPGGPGQVWVGDIGDNLRRRDTIALVRVPIGAGELTGAEPAFLARYADGPRDAETLLAHPSTGELFVVSKQALGGSAYAVPEPSGSRPVRLDEVADGLIGIATDGAFFPDGRHVIIRNYGEAAVYTFPGWAEVGRFALPDQPQGEGIAVSDQGRVYVSSEGENEPVLEVALPERISVAMAPTPPSVETPTPTASASAPDREPVEPAQSSWADLWPWLLGGLTMLAALLVLLRSLRPR